MRESCKCGAAQRGSACACGILERSVEPESYYDGAVDTWREAAQTLAASNARLCDIALAADKLAAAAQQAINDMMNLHTAALEDALDAYKIVRQGQ